MLLQELIRHREDGTVYVNSLDLHKYLNVGSRHNDWINRQIKHYNFVLNEDYLYSKLSKNAQTEALRGRPTQDRELTLNMAKELCMVEKTQRGKEIRDYFIKCEEELINLTVKNIKLGAMLLTHKEKLQLTREQLYPILDNLGVLKIKKKSVHEKILKMLVGKYENIDKYNGLDITDFKEQYREYANYLKEVNPNFFIDENQITMFEILGV